MGAADSDHVRILNILAAEVFENRPRYPVHGVERLYAWTGYLRSPWDALVLIGTVLGLYGGVLFGAWIILQSTSLVNLAIGVPILAFFAILAAHLVPH